MTPNKIICGSALEVLRDMPGESINCSISSPPYWGLRAYNTEPQIWGSENCEHRWGELLPTTQTGNLRLGGDHPRNCQCSYCKLTETSRPKSAGNFCSLCGAWRGELGLEPTIELYIDHLCTIYDEVKRVLRKDGTCWVNLGDTYWGGCGGPQSWERKDRDIEWRDESLKNPHRADKGKYPTKSLCLIPQRFAIEMVNRGWILRNVIIWSKPNPMPSSAKDRFTVDFEYVYFFCKAKEKSNDIKEWLPNPFDKVDAAWLAAMADGEGCIRVYQQNKKYYGATFAVNNTNLSLIEHCQQIAGIGTITKVPLKKGDGTRKQGWRWTVVANQAISVIAEIYPYLIAKREQAKVAIAVQKSNQKPISIQEKKEKERLWLLSKALNQCKIDLSGLPEPNLNRYGGCEKYFFEPQYEPYTAPLDRWGGDKLEATGESIWDKGTGQNAYRDRDMRPNPLGRNKRTTWTIPTEAFPEAHFATFPRKLVEPMIKAGCPRYVCTKCGTPRRKMYDQPKPPPEAYTKARRPEDRHIASSPIGGGRGSGQKMQNWLNEHPPKFKGYSSCGCENPEYKPGIVLDPFGGSCTTGEVAYEHGRDYVMVELSPEYAKMGEKRITKKTERYSLLEK